LQPVGEQGSQALLLLELVSGALFSFALGWGFSWHGTPSAHAAALSQRCGLCLCCRVTAGPADHAAVVGQLPEVGRAQYPATGRTDLDRFHVGYLTMRCCYGVGCARSPCGGS